MSKFHIFTQILQGNALFLWKNLQSWKSFYTRFYTVVTVVTNFKSEWDPYEWCQSCL